MSAYREQIALALRAVVVRSPTSYAWFGRAFRPLARTMAYDQSTQREYLIRRLEMELYRSFYSRGRPVPYRPGHASAWRPDPAFVDALAHSNRGRGGWEKGWRVEAVDGSVLQLTRDGLHVRAPASECHPEGATTGTQVRVRRPKENRSASPGFYVALGDVDPPAEGDVIDVRVYFHLTPAGAAPLIETATGLLNEGGLPFSLKVLNHPAGFTRCDAAVLYLRDGDFATARDALREIVSACTPHLRSDPPAFTKRLFRGVGVGEHLPSHGASFGMSRCRLVAEGIVAAHEHRACRVADRLDRVARCFAGRGLDVDVPYLAPGSSNGYEL